MGSASYVDAEVIDAEFLEEGGSPQALATRETSAGLEASLRWEAAYQRFENSRSDASPHTLRVYRRHVTNFFSWARLASPEEVSPAVLADYRAHLVATAGKSTQAQAIAAIRSFLRWCRAFSAAIVDPAIFDVAFSIPKAPIDRPYQTLSRAEVEAVAEATESNPRDRAAIALMLGCGLRASEAAGLRVSDLLERGGNTLLSVQGKGGKLRMVPVGPDTARALLAYLAGSGRRMGDEGPLLLATDTRADGGGMGRRALDYMVRRILGRAGVEGKIISCHSLRHTFAVRALRSGINVVSLQQILGHSSLQTTERYVRHLETAALGDSLPQVFG